MSKNTASNAFRKIDVDAFNEDNFRDEDTAGTGPQPGQGGAVASEAQIGTWIQEGKTVEALQALLSQAPISNKNQQEKVRKLGQDLLSVSISSHMHLSLLPLPPCQRKIFVAGANHEDFTRLGIRNGSTSCPFIYTSSLTGTP